ncbi:nucleotide exchange factor GrpE [Oligoflexia bacterium]|nr:nucleotide exchange factor GrpE [Oligoflexia bacterium]
MSSKRKKIKVTSGAEEPLDAADQAVERDADFSKLEESSSNNGKQQYQKDNAQGEEGAGIDEAGIDEEGVAELAPENEAVEQYQKEIEEYKGKYLRALADLENYKKRALKDRSELLKYQGERVFFDILEVVDNLELALQHAEAEPEKLKEGVELIHKRFLDILGKWEVRASSGLGQEFDPNRHAALSRVAAEGTKPGIIINELKKAYFYKDRLLRAGEVVVTADMTPPEEEGGESEESAEVAGDADVSEDSPEKGEALEAAPEADEPEGE